MFEGKNLVMQPSTTTKKSDRTVERELGVKCFVIPEFDTDELGTLGKWREKMTL
jgi:hypothetical protein